MLTTTEEKKKIIHILREIQKTPKEEAILTACRERGTSALFIVQYCQLLPSHLWECYINRAHSVLKLLTEPKRLYRVILLPFHIPNVPWMVKDTLKEITAEGEKNA
jgi:hypothetical protein